MANLSLVALLFSKKMTNSVNKTSINNLNWL